MSSEPPFRWRFPGNFLGLASEEFPRPKVVVLPIPYEATTSYEGGTRHGPEAILRASAQVELYDPDFEGEPVFAYGLRTLPFLEPVVHGPEAMLQAVARCVEEQARQGLFVVALGGEHSLSLGVGKGLQAALGEPLAVVHFDAHCDLRDTYEGSPYSHACVARRLLEAGLQPLLQLGVRSYSQEEALFLRQHPEQVWMVPAERIHTALEEVRRELADRLIGRKVFLTFDADALDPSLMPAVGTPEPNGLTWEEVLSLLRTIASQAEVVGMDWMELSPRPGLHHADFTLAKLIYKTLNVLFG